MCVLDITYPTAIAFLSPSEKKFGEIQLHNPESLYPKWYKHNLALGVDQELDS
ncbi:MAG: hypothetical protein V7L20_21425 [Nostoc sp.]|uniref:hypothetical protein n=1 Tax=Nostoc sp. TaxID=1180 RepID=UPI002FFAC7EA